MASNDLVQTNSPGLGKVESDVRFRDLGYPSNPQQEAAERDSSYCFRISFDDGGNATVEFLLGDSFFEEDGNICTLTDILTEYQKEQNLGHLLAQELGISDSGMELAGTVGYQPFGIMMFISRFPPTATGIFWHMSIRLLRSIWWCLCCLS